MNNKGFSLLELIVALGITLCISMVGFRLFLQNERAFQDQYLISEMQQTARAVTFQISEEAPLWQARASRTMNPPSTHPTAKRLRRAFSMARTRHTCVFGAALSNVETSVVHNGSCSGYHRHSTSIIVSVGVEATPLYFLQRSEHRHAQSDVSRMSLDGLALNSCWGWTRVELSSISRRSNEHG